MSGRYDMHGARLICGLMEEVAQHRGYTTNFEELRKNGRTK